MISLEIGVFKNQYFKKYMVLVFVYNTGYTVHYVSKAQRITKYNSFYIICHKETTVDNWDKAWWEGQAVVSHTSSLVYRFVNRWYVFLAKSKVFCSFEKLQWNQL